MYRPSGIKRAEELIPGAMMLRARQKPQKKKEGVPSGIWTDMVFRRQSKANTISMHKKKAQVQPFSSPCSLA